MPDALELGLRRRMRAGEPPETSEKDYLSNLVEFETEVLKSFWEEKRKLVAKLESQEKELSREQKKTLELTKKLYPFVDQASTYEERLLEAGKIGLSLEKYIPDYVLVTAYKRGKKRLFLYLLRNGDLCPSTQRALERLKSPLLAEDQEKVKEIQKNSVALEKELEALYTVIAEKEKLFSAERTKALDAKKERDHLRELEEKKKAAEERRARRKEERELMKQAKLEKNA